MENIKSNSVLAALCGLCLVASASAQVVMDRVIVRAERPETPWIFVRPDNMGLSQWTYEAKMTAERHSTIPIPIIRIPLHLPVDLNANIPPGHYMAMQIQKITSEAEADKMTQILSDQALLGAISDTVQMSIAGPLVGLNAGMVALAGGAVNAGEYLAGEGRIHVGDFVLRGSVFAYGWFGVELENRDLIVFRPGADGLRDDLRIWAQWMEEQGLTFFDTLSIAQMNAVLGIDDGTTYPEMP